MMKTESQIIDEIIDKYPSPQWYDRILEAIPGIDKGYLISVVEIANGGDVIEVDEDGTERPYFG